MPNKFARANGNFNDAIWASTPVGVAGSVSAPISVDDVWANSFIVSLTGNVVCRTLNNGVSATSDGTSITGGYFLVDSTTQTASVTSTIGINADTAINVVVLSGSQNISLTAPSIPSLSGAVVYGGNNNTTALHTGLGVRSFCTNNTVTIRGTIFMGSGLAGQSIGLSIEPASSSTYNITGDLSKFTGTRGGTAGACVLRCDSSFVTINLTGNLLMSNGSSTYVENVVMLNNGTLNHTGSFASAVGPISPNHADTSMIRIGGGIYNLTTPSLYMDLVGPFGANFPIVLNAGGIVNINAGSVIGGPAGATWAPTGVSTTSGVTNIIASTIQGGSSTGRVAINSTGGTTKIICGSLTTAAAGVAAVTSTGGVLTINSSQINNHADGTQAIYAPVYRVDPVPTNSYIRYARNGTGVGSDAYLYQFTTDSLSAFSMPPISSVRAGVQFANNTLTGTCLVPSPSSVSFGTLVDNTSGTAVVSVNDLFQIFSTPLSSLTTPNTIGSRIRTAATTEAAGNLIASFTNG